MIEPRDLDDVKALLAAAGTTPDREVRTLYIAVARARLDRTAERLKEARWLLENAERELARSQEPHQTTLPEGP